MADKACEKKTEVPVEEPEKAKKEVVEEKKAENGKENAKVENGDVEEKKAENGGKLPAEEEEAEEEEKCEKKDDVCSMKRKSAGGDAPDGTPAEGATPEKKAKLDEKQPAAAETQAKENVEAAA